MSAIRNAAIKQDRKNREKTSKKYYINEAKRNGGIYEADPDVIKRVAELFRNDNDWCVRYKGTMTKKMALYFKPMSLHQYQCNLFNETVLKILHIPHNIVIDNKHYPAEIYGCFARVLYNAQKECISSLVTFLLCAKQSGLHKDISHNIAKQLYLSRFDDLAWIGSDGLSDMIKVYIWIDWSHTFGKNVPRGELYPNILKEYWNKFRSLPGWYITEVPMRDRFSFTCDIKMPDNDKYIEVNIDTNRPSRAHKSIYDYDENIAIRYNHKKQNYEFRVADINYEYIDYYAHENDDD